MVEAIAYQYWTGIAWRDLPRENNGFTNNVMQAVSSASGDYNPELRRLFQRRVAGWIEECLGTSPRDSDMLAGVDAVEKIAPVDDKRLGLYGHSYGGWFSMWANTQTRRFKAFVAGAGIADWTSYYGQNGIDQWMIPFFGASVYDDPAVYRAASPIEFIKHAKTPALLYVGERDVECPAPQSLEYWHALHALGTPVQLYIYAGEGHHFNDPAHLIDLRARIIGWFDKYLK